MCKILKKIMLLSLSLVILSCNLAIYAAEFIDGNDYGVGEVVTFGKYEQDANEENGTEDIEWKILDKNGNLYLLYSTKILDFQPFNTSPGHITYASSSIRRFLNGSFYNKAFSASEKSMLVKIKNTNLPNVKFNINAGADTEDNVFILSLDEYIKYFGDVDAKYENRSAATYGTMYAYGKGLDVNNNEDMWCNGFSPYWLRTPGSYRTAAIYVSSNGGYVLWGDLVEYSYGVRPAIWVELK